jgi:hypothetical protein
MPQVRPAHTVGALIEHLHFQQTPSHPRLTVSPVSRLALLFTKGRVEMMRTLLALGSTPQDNDEIVRDALASRNLMMLDLLAASGVSINAGANLSLSSEV